MEPELPNRKNIRLPNYDYSKPGFYFITICTQNRNHLFGKIINDEMKLNDAGWMVQRVWNELPEIHTYIKVDTFIMMPNHVHGIIHIVGGDSISPRKPPRDSESISVRGDSISPRNEPHDSESCTVGDSKSRAEKDSAPTLGTVVQTFKRYSTIKYIKMVKNGMAPPFNKRIWQRNYWEHIVRNEYELGRIREYILHNPKKWNQDRLNDSKGKTLKESTNKYGTENWRV